MVHNVSKAVFIFYLLPESPQYPSLSFKYLRLNIKKKCLNIRFEVFHNFKKL